MARRAMPGLLWRWRSAAGLCLTHLKYSKAAHAFSQPCMWAENYAARGNSMPCFLALFSACKINFLSGIFGGFWCCLYCVSTIFFRVACLFSYNRSAFLIYFYLVVDLAAQCPINQYLFLVVLVGSPQQ